jgi:hypothetical protein
MAINLDHDYGKHDEIPDDDSSDDSFQSDISVQPIEPDKADRVR